MLKRLLITGAAGALGSHCRQNLDHLTKTVRVSDITNLGSAAPHEEVVQADLSDRSAFMSLVEGCDGIAISAASRPKASGASSGTPTSKACTISMERRASQAAAGFSTPARSCCRLPFGDGQSRRDDQYPARHTVWCVQGLRRSAGAVLFREIRY